MSVKLRKKKLADGSLSLYLDIYHNKERSYDFLDIKLKGKLNTTENKEKLVLAEKIRLDLEHRLKVTQYHLPNEYQLDCDLFEYINLRPAIKKQRLKCLCTHLRKFAKTDVLPFRVITKEWLLSFQQYLLANGERLDNTVNFYMAKMTTLLNEAAQEEIIPFNPWKKVPAYQKAKMTIPPIDPLEPSEIRQMLEHTKGIDPEIVNCFLFSVFTGLRWSDVSNLTRASVRPILIDGNRRKFIVFSQVKTKTVTSIPLTSDAITVLAKSLLEQRKVINNRRSMGIIMPDPTVFFPRLTVKEGQTSGSRHALMNYGLKKWAKQAGITKRVYFHLSRHTFATLGIEKIGDLHIVSKLLGHKRLTTTQRYAHVLDRLKVESIDRMTSFGIMK